MCLGLTTQQPAHCRRPLPKPPHIARKYGLDKNELAAYLPHTYLRLMGYMPLALCKYVVSGPLRISLVARMRHQVFHFYIIYIYIYITKLWFVASETCET